MTQISLNDLAHKVPPMLHSDAAEDKILVEFEGKVIGTLALHSEEPSVVRREPGFAKGRFLMSDDFDEPLEDFKQYM